MSKSRHIAINLIPSMMVELLFSTLYTICIAAMPYMNKLLFDEGFSGGFRTVINLLIVYFLLASGSALFQYISQRHEWIVDYKFSTQVKDHIFRSFYCQRPNAYHSKGTGEYVSIINNNVTSLMEEYVEVIIEIIKASLQIAVYTAVMILFVDLRITLVLITSSLISVLVPRITSKKISALRKKHLDDLGKYTATMKDYLDGYDGLDYRSRNTIMLKHREHLFATEQSKYHWGCFKTLTNIINGGVMDFITISAFAIIGILFIKGEITVGTGVATFGYVESFIYPIRYILNGINALNSSNKIKEEMKQIIEDGKSTLEDTCLIEAPTKLSLRNATATLGNFKLASMSYDFVKNKKYAIIGQSGSGKSTLAGILDGTISLAQGMILANDNDITTTINEFASMNVCSSKQDQHVFSASYEENVSNFGTYDTSSLKGIEELFPREVITQIKSTSSDKLSGGEKQIIAFIKSILTQKSILIYDESFSSIDKANACVIRDMIDHLHDRIIIEITHDTSEENLNRFDHVLTFHKGALQ